jgi:two-component system sensor histidine kinase HydH
VVTKGKNFKSLYLPAWTIVAAVLVLLVVIAFSTYRNMSRATGRMEESLLREGLVILRAIEAGIRADYPAHPPDRGHLNNLLAEVAREPGIAAITIFAISGEIVAASDAATIGGTIREAPALDLLLQGKGVITRYRQNQRGGRVFEIIRPFRPFTVDALSRVGEPPGQGAGAPPDPLHRWAGDKLIILNLGLDAVEAARREDRYHTLLMAAILLALGTGALYFIFIVQNYYLVNQTLGRMRSYTENVVESIADGLITIDRQGRVVTVNRRALTLFGGSRESLEGQPLADILGGAGEGIPFIDPGPAPVPEREIEIRRGTAAIPLSIRVAPLTDEEGRDMGVVLLLRDLREIRTLQEKVARGERLASLGRLAAGMAHEIRNPLSAIRGFAQYFRKRFSGQAEEEGYADVMVREVDRMNRVITDLLDFAGPKPLHREPCPLGEIVTHALHLLGPDITARAVRVERDEEPDLPPVPVDRDQMTQVILNLLLNALESMQTGGTIRIGLKRCGPPPAVEIRIADTGIGIAAEDLPQVFEPFFSRKRKGSGLGLAIVHQIVEAHRGNIDVASRPGEGTSFRIRLPL